MKRVKGMLVSTHIASFIKVALSFQINIIILGYIRLL